jgi:hypothetical protein
MPTTPNQPQPPPLPPASNNNVFEPMPDPRSPLLVIEALLKHPGRIIHELHHKPGTAIGFWLLFLGLVGMTCYGVLVGSFSGGAQLWVAPAKVAVGTLLSIFICLPSLYVFACLGGINTQSRTVAGTFFAAIGVAALLLLGFAPVAWIFSQATDSVAFMGALHLGLWGIGILFGLRLIEAMGQLLSGSARNHLKLWGSIFILVCLQMMTSLRPIVGTSAHFLPQEKKFFLAHWFETMNGSAAGKTQGGLTNEISFGGTKLAALKR